MLGRLNDGRKRIDAKSANIKKFFIILYNKNTSKTNVIE